jgi:ankyrin repeat protein
MISTLLFTALFPSLFTALAMAATDLPTAALQDDVAAAKVLLRDGANVKAANRYGVTPLSIACTNGSAPMIELLLKAGADANTTLPGGETVLMTAARTGRVEAVNVLLANGADPNFKEPRRGQTALMWAAAEGHTAVVEALIAKGASFRDRLPTGYTPFLFAAREGRAAVIEALLRAGVDVNEVITATPNAPKVNGAPREGTSALHLAVLSGHFELASMLLDRGANPNADANGWTALHAITGVRKPGGGDNNPAPLGSGTMTSIELVRKLKAKGANLNARMSKRINVGLTSLNTLGATPFMLAARSADFELMRELAKLGADPLIPNADGSTPLMAAAGLGTRSPGEDAGTEEEVVEAIKVALELGNDINAVDKNGETAMHSAAYKNYGAAIQLLVDRGAKIEVWNKKNKSGWTPLAIAQGYRFGNFKPSPPTEAALRKAFAKAGFKPEEFQNTNHSD